MLEGVEQISPTEPCGDRLVIDVRQDYEVESSPLPDKDTRNIPVVELREKCKEIPKDKPLIAICSKGIRSAESVRILKENGYSDVKYVGGGVIMKHPK